MKTYFSTRFVLWLWAVVGSCSVLCSVLSNAQTASILRPYTVDDFLAMEEVKDFTFSSDGVSLAYERKRPRTSNRQDFDFVHGIGGGDIWVQVSPGQAPRNVTQGERDGSSWWSPQWSADGQWLSMRSTRGSRGEIGKKVSVWAWNKGTGKLKQLMSQPPLFHLNVNEVWLDSRRLLVPLAAAADTIGGSGMGPFHPILPPGDAVTASVLEGGAQVALGGESWPQGKLVLVDVPSGTQQVITQRLVTEIFERGNYVKHFVVSPNKKWIATLRVDSVFAPKGTKYGWYVEDWLSLSLEMYSHDGRPVTLNKHISGVKSPTMVWSPDGEELVFLSVGSSRTALPKLIRVSPARGEVSIQDLSLVIDTTSFDLNRGSLTYVTSSKQSRDLLLNVGSPFVHEEKYTKDNTPRVPEPSVNILILVTKAGRVIPKAQADSIRGMQLIDDRMRDARMTSIEKAVRSFASGAQIIAVSPTGTSAIYQESGPRKGLKVLRVNVGMSPGMGAGKNAGVNAILGKPDTLVVANTHTRNIEQSVATRFKYTSLRGQTLTASLGRPANILPGVKLPLIVRVYHQKTEDAFPSPGPLFNEWIAKGYLVLFPSMPYSYAEGNEPIQNLQNGVFPAIDSLIAQGIADPDRVFVSGHSNGAWTTMALVTQTNRFKAAAAANGYYDNASIAATFIPQRRFSGARPVENKAVGFDFVMWDQPDMGGKPWDMPEEYRRNSPFWLANRIQTPVLLLHGDIDMLPMEQAEMMYSALMRQGNRVRFVRYWGESHVIGTIRPSNKRDSFYQELSWFDEHGDISRDDKGNIIFENGRAKSRGGKPPLTVIDYTRFDSLILGRAVR